MTITKRGRFWAVHDVDGQLVCLTVYKKGAREVVRRLTNETQFGSAELLPTRTATEERI